MINRRAFFRSLLAAPAIVPPPIVLEQRRFPDPNTPCPVCGVTDPLTNEYLVTGRTSADGRHLQVVVIEKYREVICHNCGVPRVVDAHK